MFRVFSRQDLAQRANENSAVAYRQLRNTCGLSGILEITIRIGEQTKQTDLKANPRPTIGYGGHCCPQHRQSDPSSYDFRIVILLLLQTFRRRAARTSSFPPRCYVTAKNLRKPFLLSQKEVAGNLVEHSTLQEAASSSGLECSCSQSAPIEHVLASNELTATQMRMNIQTGLVLSMHLSAGHQRSDRWGSK